MAAQYVRITPTDSYSSAKSGTVSGDSVRMRMGPSTDFAAIGTLSKGTSVKISGETGSWYEISANGKYGYMSKDYIKGVSTASTDTVEKMDKIGIVTGNGVRMRPFVAYSGFRNACLLHSFVFQKRKKDARR